MWLLYTVAASAHNFAIVVTEEFGVYAAIFADEWRYIHHGGHRKYLFSAILTARPNW
jgi:hypothetical protein